MKILGYRRTGWGTERKPKEENMKSGHWTECTKCLQEISWHGQTENEEAAGKKPQHIKSVPISWSVVKKKKIQREFFPGQDYPDQTKRNAFSLSLWTRGSLLIWFAELPLSRLPTLSSTSPATPQHFPVPVTLNGECKERTQEHRWTFWYQNRKACIVILKAI